MKTNTTLHPVDQPLEMRHLTARVWKSFFFLSTIIAVTALTALLLSIINQSFGYVVIENKVQPAAVAPQPLETLPPESLIEILRSSLNRNRIRAIERQGLLVERSQAELFALVMENIIRPEVVASYNLDQSLFNRLSIEAAAAEKYPHGALEFRSWLNRGFLLNAMNSKPELTGVRGALIGSLLLILITIAFALPAGVGAAIYLEEYADTSTRINRVIQANIDNLAGVPSIVYGILGLAIFVRGMEAVTSGAVFGVTDSNGRTVLSAGLTMALLILPIIIINAQEAIRAVPKSLRDASYGLGGTKWQTIWNHVLPYALPGILTGTILAISRAIGETAPLIVVGASTLLTQDPSGPFSKFTALPVQIYNWTSRPQAEYRHIAAAAILVLLVTLLSMNAIAVILRNRFSRKSL